MTARAYYFKPIPDFLADSEAHILGELANRHGFKLGEPQRNDCDTTDAYLRSRDVDTLDPTGAD